MQEAPKTGTSLSRKTDSRSAREKKYDLTSIQMEWRGARGMLCQLPQWPALNFRTADMSLTFQSNYSWLCHLDMLNAMHCHHSRYLRVWYKWDPSANTLKWGWKASPPEEPKLMPTFEGCPPQPFAGLDLALIKFSQWESAATLRIYKL